jgi:hypothetical protein
MNVGDRVKPVATFEFGLYAGPDDLNDRGTIVEVHPPFGETYGPIAIVQWDEGRKSDHATFADRGAGLTAYREFGVVLVEEEAEEATEEEATDVAEEATPANTHEFPIGTRVKPVETFDFDNFVGPADVNDEGTVVGYDLDGDPVVEWDRGRRANHLTNDNHPDYDFAEFGVVKV